MSTLYLHRLVFALALIAPTLVAAETCRTSRGVACADSCSAGETKERRTTCVYYRGARCVSWAEACYCTKDVPCE